MKSFAAFLLVSLCAITYAKAKAVSQVSGGADALPKRYAMVWRDKDYMCGASIIHENYVLTAAHCVHNKEGIQASADELRVIVGTNKRSREDGDNYKVSAVHVHPDYELIYYYFGKFYDSNLAILKLSKKITFNDKVQPVTLPKADSKLHENTSIGFMGFRKSNSNGSKPEVLQFVNNQILDRTTCLRDAIPNLIRIDHDHSCIKEPLVDGVSLDDFGFPAVTNGSVQVLIASFRVNGEVNWYTKVARYLDWIDSIFKSMPFPKKIKIHVPQPEGMVD